MFDTSRYTIGWVCAIPPELVAARLHLDTEHSADEYEAPPNDDNAYVFGAIGKHNIVIATLPNGEYGTSSAAGVARDMIRSFTNVRIAFMVGIGGGAPLVGHDVKRRQDIQLGDVIVSTPTNGRGGVVQYDYGKAIQEREFRLTGHLNSPPRSLLTAVTTLKTDFDINGYDLDKDVSNVLACRGSRKLEKSYRRPDSETNRLYNSTFVHPDENQSCSRTCNIEQEIVQRADRDEGEDVTIHYGLIASANTLMKDALLRDRLATEHGILCFEMEAAGLMNQLPFLVIRGICDYSDSHKNEGWQGYAAMTAAAYAKKLLLRLAPSKVETEKKLSELQELKSDVQRSE